MLIFMDLSSPPSTSNSNHPHLSTQPYAYVSSASGVDGASRPYTSDLASVEVRKKSSPVFLAESRHTTEVVRRPPMDHSTHRGSLTSLALFGVLFANCIGGGYGFENAVSAAGPLITLIVCIILPWMWSFPTGLAVAELSTSVPSNSGVLMWTNAAFPPFISFLCILGTIFIIFIGNATYPNLTAAYFSNLIDLSGWQVALIKVAVILFCCVMNCVGVEVVGNSTVILCCITICPFLLLTLIQLFGHGFNSAVLHCELSTVNWSDFFSIISWNYANIENAGAMVEEVRNPKKALPMAMMYLMFGSYVAYVIPMLAGVSAMGADQDFSLWVEGHWPDVAEVVAGPWLKYMLFVGAIFSGVGFTVTSICCTSRLLAGIGSMHIFPPKISRLIGYYHPRLGTPIIAIIINSLVTGVFSITMDFTSVVALCQSLYCLRMLLIYGALIRLRISYPRLARPYHLPCNTTTAILCLLPAAVFSLFAAVVSSMTSLGIGLAVICFVVGGSAISWIYCRLFARNGFQGVIVNCWEENEEEDEHEVLISGNKMMGSPAEPIESETEPLWTGAGDGAHPIHLNNLPPPSSLLAGGGDDDTGLRRRHGNGSFPAATLLTPNDADD